MTQTSQPAALVLDSRVLRWAVDGQPASGQQALDALAAGQPLLVLMHGLGSNEDDLIGLAPFLPTEFVCVSPRAPLTAYAPHSGYSWFPLSLQPGGVEPEQARGTAEVAARAVLNWLDALAAQLTAAGSQLGRVSLMGFSQGGVLVTTLLRLAPDRFVAGVNCSGFVAPGTFTGDAELRRSRPPLFWGRDVADPVIGAAAIRLTSEWSPAHTALEERHYPGIAHSISRAELRDISDFLRAAGAV